MKTSNFSAEYGRHSGAAINIVTRSGSSSYHGTLLEFVRNDQLDAANFFSPVKGKLRFNNCGWSLGGPIKKGKLVNDPKNNDRVLQDERAVLAALCQGKLLRADRDEAVARLATYRFAEAIHQLVFDTLAEMNTSDARVIREQLAARLNNKGFPDLDVEGFFSAQNLSARQVADRISLLCALR